MTYLKRHKEPKKQGRYNRKIYQSHRWHEYSRQYRKKHPLCVNCLKQGKTVLAQVTDHISPITQGGDVWDPDNHQSLCIRCHNQKTKQEQK